MDGNPRTSVLNHYQVKSMHEKKELFTLNGEPVLNSASVMNGYSGKPADNDGSGSESGYTTPKKRRAGRGGMKGTETASREKEKAAKPCSEQDTETLAQETASGKALRSLPNNTGTFPKPETHTGGRRTGARDSSPVAEVQVRNSDCKTVSVVAKKTDDRVNKAKLISSVSCKEDPWTLFKPPPVFPVDNSSAKIVPKISYASKVKENLNKATQASTETSGKPSHVPMSAVKTVTSAGFANVAASLDAHRCHSVEMSFSSAAGVSVAPPASAHQAAEDALSAPRNGCGLSSCPSAPEPRKSSLFVYPHKPLNMQPCAAQTNQKALGNIFQNQWGLSFINEPNAGPDGAPVSRPAAPLEISDITFQGANLPFLIQPSLNAVSLPAPQSVQRRTNGGNVAVKTRSASCTSRQGCPRARPGRPEGCSTERRSSDASYESTINYEGLSGTHTVKEQDGGAAVWGWADLQAAVLYHTKEFEHLLTLHKQDPKRVTYYEEVVDGPDH